VVGDVSGQRRDPVQSRENLEVPLEDRVHLRPVDDRPGLRLVAHLLLGERGPEDVLGERLPSRVLLRGKADCIVDAEARMPPPQQLPDQRLVDPPLAPDLSRDFRAPL